MYKNRCAYYKAFLERKGNDLLLGWRISCVIADRVLVPYSIQPG